MPALEEGWEDRAAMVMLTQMPAEEIYEKLLADVLAKREANENDSAILGFVFGAGFGLGYALGEVAP
jgi:hypothetical protein